jgi:hypothetical protein
MLAVLGNAALVAGAVLCVPASGAGRIGERVAASHAGPPAIVDRHTLARTIITTDGEADDINSFIRLLYYANELDIDGLVYTSSIHHWKGDGVHTLRQAQQAGLITSYRGETAGSDARSDDALAWRWEPPGWMEDKLLRDYSKVYPNMLKHDPNYPSPAELWSKVAVGNVTWENDFGADTEGSNLIKAALLDDDPRPLYLEAWGGTNTIARALISIENEYRSAANWREIQARVTQKARIAAIGQQDNAYRDYIAKSWPAIRVLNFDGVFGGFSSYIRSQVPPEILPYYKAEFWAKHIKYGHGPLLEGYGLIGDGTYFVGEGRNPGWQPGQARDMATFKFFGFLGGYQRLDWTGEGDTPSFISLVPTGLRFLQDPSLGGWGGRLQKSKTDDITYTESMDYNPYTRKPASPYTAARWMPAIGNDFAARADWGVTGRFEDANHAPGVAVEGRADLNGAPGQSVTLTVRANDPDGDSLTASWWIYTDASTVTGAATVKGRPQGRLFGAIVTIPQTARFGERIVVVAAISDNGSPSLTRYAEFVVTVARFACDGFEEGTRGCIE